MQVPDDDTLAQVLAATGMRDLIGSMDSLVVELNLAVETESKLQDIVDTLRSELLRLGEELAMPPVSAKEGLEMSLRSFSEDFVDRDKYIAQTVGTACRVWNEQRELV